VVIKTIVVTMSYCVSSCQVIVNCQQGQVNYVNIVIKPLDNATNAVTVQAKPGQSTNIIHFDG